MVRNSTPQTQDRDSRLISKVVIYSEDFFQITNFFAGNHDMSLDPSHDKSLQKMFYQHYSNLYEGGLGAGDNDLCAEDMKKLLTNCVYLEDSWISLYGYKIYGSPWTPEYGSMGFR